MQIIQNTLEKIAIKYDRIIRFTDFVSLENTESHNKNMTYGQFVRSLQKPKITSKKGGAGGFIGGYVKETRSKSNVQSRSMITIDIDDISNIDVWGNVKDYTNFASLLYSSHNSTPSKPRYRLIIPLKDDIKPEQYKTVTQFLVDMLHINIDETSYQFERIMFYPTCENDDNYQFHYQDLPFFDPTDIVKQSKTIQSFTNGEFKKRDPRTKENWIGAWCNTYSIEEVLLTFLPDVYEPYADDRYSFIEGSTKGGLVIYDEGQHAHSNHGTDPISGMNVNSFDLYRIHQFSHLDDGTEDMQDNPSYKAMIEHCKQDVAVKAYYDEHINFELNVKDSPVIDLKKELNERRLKELSYLEKEWEDDGKNGRKPTNISTVRCSIILIEYISFALYDMEENTRLAMYLPIEGIYTQNTTFIKRIISWLEPKLNNVKAEEVIYHITNRAEVKEKTESRYLIPVDNGVFNLKTKTLEPFNPDYVFTTKISTKYIENLSTPTMDGWDVENWLNSIACGDKEIVNLLWQVINDSLNGNYSRKKAIFLIGEGNNGKGTFQQLITNLIGAKNMATLKVNEFEQRFRLSVLEGKTAVIGDDVPANVYIDDSSNFNSVVTGDPVGIEFKNKPLYNTILKCTVIQSTNGMPKFRNKTQGTTRRLVIVPFKADFNGKTENFKIKEDYIGSEEVLQYVLYKAINKDFEQFDIPRASLEEMETFKQDNDPILDFKLSIFDEWKIQKVPKYIVYGFYKKFCNDNGYKYSSDRVFHRQFKTYLGDEWETDAQAKYNYETLMRDLGDLDELRIGFPDRGQNKKSYKNTKLEIV